MSPKYRKCQAVTPWLIWSAVEGVRQFPSAGKSHPWTTTSLRGKLWANFQGHLSIQISPENMAPSDWSIQMLKKRERVPEVGTKPLKALRGYRASNRGSNRGSRGSNRGSKGSRKTPEALRG